MTIVLSIPSPGYANTGLTLFTGPTAIKAEYIVERTFATYQYLFHHHRSTAAAMTYFASAVFTTKQTSREIGRLQLSGDHKSDF